MWKSVSISFLLVLVLIGLAAALGSAATPSEQRTTRAFTTQQEEELRSAFSERDRFLTGLAQIVQKLDKECVKNAVPQTNTTP